MILVRPFPVTRNPLLNPLKFELTTPTVGNFNIGDFIIGMESNCLAMIVPYYWNEINLP